MTLQDNQTVSFSSSLIDRSIRKPLQVASAFALVVGLLQPGALLASETPATPITASAEVALHSQSLTSPAEIRLKLHRLEHLGSGAASEAPVADSADELKKQAQAAYLAAKFKKQEATVRKFVDLAWAEASRRDWLAPELLIAIMQKESALRPKVQNRYGAQGLMQVVRRWHRDKLHPSESLFDPEVNIRVGADVLEEYLERADGNMDKALRKYSGNARGYAKTILRESQALARVAEQAASNAQTAQG